MSTKKNTLSDYEAEHFREVISKNSFKISNRLTEERKNKNFSMQYVADCLSCSKSTITKMENSISNYKYPNFEKFMLLADLYECDVEYLLGMIDTRRFSNKDIVEETGLSEKAIETLRHHGYKIDAGNGETFRPYNSEFLSFFIENSEPIRLFVEREVNLIQIGKQWEDEEGFQLLKFCFKKALEKNPFIPSIKIYFNGNHEEEVIAKAIDIFHQYDQHEKISPLLNVVNEDGTPNDEQLHRIFNYLYEHEIKTKERRFEISERVMEIINEYIEQRVNNGNAE